MTIVLLCKLSFIRVSSVKEELLPFDCLNFNDFVVLGHNYVTKKLILDINEHVVVTDVKFHQEVISYR